MRAGRFVLVGAIAIAGALTTLKYRVPRTSHAASDVSTAATAPTPPPKNVMPRPLLKVPIVAQTNNPHPNYLQQFRDAEDLWEFAQSLHASATEGNGAAQFYLHTVLSECRFWYGFYFVRNFSIGGNGVKRHRTLDEGLQFAVKRRGGVDLEEVRAIYARCHRLEQANETPFGQEDDWLHAATDNAYPQAQIKTAIDRALESRKDPASKGAEDARDQARQLVLEVLRSKDAAALSQVGDVEMFMNGQDKTSLARHEWVWLLAACQRGNDCSRQSEWYRFYCHGGNGCEPFDSGPVDVVRRLTGTRFYDLERRATDLNAMIDAGRFDELGLED